MACPDSSTSIYSGDIVLLGSFDVQPGLLPVSPPTPSTTGCAVALVGANVQPVTGLSTRQPNNTDSDCIDTVVSFFSRPGPTRWAVIFVGCRGQGGKRKATHQLSTFMVPGIQAGLLPRMRREWHRINVVILDQPLSLPLTVGGIAGLVYLPRYYS